MNNLTFTYPEKKLFNRLSLKVNNQTGAVIVNDKISENPLKYVRYSKSEQDIIKNADHKITENIHMFKKIFETTIIKCDIIK